MRKQATDLGVSGLEDPTGRPVPFVLRVGVSWFEMTGDKSGDGLIFADRAGLTGELGVTRSGGDLTLSDIEVDS